MQPGRKCLASRGTGPSAKSAPHLVRHVLFHPALRLPFVLRFIILTIPLEFKKTLEAWTIKGIVFAMSCHVGLPGAFGENPRRHGWTRLEILARMVPWPGCYVPIPLLLTVLWHSSSALSLG